MELHVWSGYPLYNLEARNRATNFLGSGTTVPYVYIDGTRTSTNYEAAIVNRMNIPSPMTDTIWGIYNPTTRKGRVYVRYRNDSTATINGNIYFVIIQDSIRQSAPNGDSIHNDVIRDYLQTEVGYPVTVPVSQYVTKDDTFYINPSWNVNKCYIIAWIQLTSGIKSVYQASMIKVASLSTGIDEDADSKISNRSDFITSPNPCVNYTRFSFWSPDVASYTLRIFDISGRGVWRTTGHGAVNHTIYWNCRNNQGERVRPGVYLYIFESNALKRDGCLIVK